jgi:hypothetical protein
VVQHTESCATCSHQWITHSVKADALANFHFSWIRGSCSESSCGGFFNVGTRVRSLPIIRTDASFSFLTTGGIILFVSAAPVGIITNKYQTFASNSPGPIISTRPLHLLPLLCSYLLRSPHIPQLTCSQGSLHFCPNTTAAVCHAEDDDPG